MSDNRIHWGIIGCGDVAEIKSGPALQKAPRSGLVAVMRRNRTKAKDFAKRHKVQHWYIEAGDLLRHPDINAVYIATPPSSHVEYAIQAIHAGKDIYLEKPAGRTAAEAFKILEALKGSGSKLTVAHYRRKMVAFEKVAELLRKKTIGQVRLVDIRILQPARSGIIASTEENWRVLPEISGGGYFHDLAPHQIDLMLSWFGKPVKVKGIAVNQQKVYPANDVVNGVMEFENGIQVRGVWAFNVSEYDQEDKCVIYGDKGSIRFSFFGDRVELVNLDGTQLFDIPAIPHVQQPMIEATVRFFLGEDANPCSLEDAMAGLEVMEALNT